MEFPYNCEKLLGCDPDGFVLIDGKKGMNSLASASGAFSKTTSKQSIFDAQNAVCEIIDKIGAASSKA
jgi:hypothetical protein